MMKSYEKGKLPQIIWGSKSADRVGTELKSADVQKCLIVSGSHVIKHPITQKIIHSLESIGIPCDVFDRVLPEPTDSLCIEIAQEIKVQSLRLYSGHWRRQSYGCGKSSLL